MVVDAHTHASENGLWFEPKCDASLERLLREMHEAGLEKCVLISLESFVSNDFVGKFCKENSDKFVGIASTNLLKKDFQKTLFEQVQRYELKGLKIHARLQKFELDRPEVIELAKNFSKEFELPITVDAWLQNDEYGEQFLERLNCFVDALPDAKIVVAHSGGHLCKETVDLLVDNQNVWFDLAYSIARLQGKEEKKLQYVIKNVPNNRLIYGSDFPEVNLKENLGIARAFFSRNGLTEEEQELILGKNVKTLIL